jgi:hypothetical protein
VTDDRRQHPRIASPLDGTWRGASGALLCRVGDVSLGGCFVYSMAQPAVGEDTDVTMTLGESLSITVGGRVVSVEPTIGFGVQFTRLSADELDRLSEILQRLRTRV